MAIIYDVSSFKKLNKLVNNAKIKIGLFGGRYVQVGRYGQVKFISLNKLFKKAIELEKQPLDNKNQAQAQLFFGNLKRLDQEGQQKLKNSFFLKRILTTFKRFFGNHNNYRDEISKRYRGPLTPCGTFTGVSSLIECTITAPPKIDEKQLTTNSTQTNDPKTAHDALLTLQTTPSTTTEQSLISESTGSMSSPLPENPPDESETEYESASDSEYSLSSPGLSPISSPPHPSSTLKRFESSHDSSQELQEAYENLMLYTEVSSDSKAPPDRNAVKSPEPISSMGSIEGVTQRWWTNRLKKIPQTQLHSPPSPGPVLPPLKEDAIPQWLNPTHELIENSLAELKRKMGIDKSQLWDLVIKLGIKGAAKSEDESLLVFLAIAHNKPFVPQNSEQIEKLKSHIRFIKREELEALQLKGIHKRTWYLCPSKDQTTVRLAILTSCSKKLFPLDHLEFKPLVQDLKALGFNLPSKHKKRRRKTSTQQKTTKTTIKS